MVISEFHPHYIHLHFSWNIGAVHSPFVLVIASVLPMRTMFFKSRWISMTDCSCRVFICFPWESSRILEELEWDFMGVFLAFCGNPLGNLVAQKNPESLWQERYMSLWRNPPPFPHPHMVGFITIFLFTFSFLLVGPLDCHHQMVAFRAQHSAMSVPRPPPGPRHFGDRHGECGGFRDAWRTGNASEAGMADGRPDTVHTFLPIIIYRPRHD